MKQPREGAPHRDYLFTQGPLSYVGGQSFSNEFPEVIVEKEYLGDGVYVEPDCGGLRLTTENGINVTNTIVLEPEVYAALLRYADKHRQPETKPT